MMCHLLVRKIFALWTRAPQPTTLRVVRQPVLTRFLPLLISFALHLLLIAVLAPGHDEGHTVQLFKGVVELGESGDGHAAMPHVHTKNQRRRRQVQPSAIASEPSPQSEESDTAQSEAQDSSEPIEVASLPGTGPAGSTGEMDEGARYLLSLVEKIRQVRTYPRAALLKEEEGTVLIAVTVNRDGTVAATEVLKACPFESLNRAAVDSIRAASPFPALPEIWNRSIRVRIPMTYQLNKP
ncbi:MAG: hypothetical protein RJB38_1953 [Pseudomonadota bacterium]|jgi:protein TonB